MGFKLENQKPQLFYSTEPNLPLIDIADSEDEYGRQLKAHTFELFVRPLYTPNGTKNVRISNDETGAEIAPIDFTEALLQYLQTDTVDQELTDKLNTLYEKGSKHSLTSQLGFDQFMALEALAEVNLPYPETGHVIYTPGEVKDAAAALLHEVNKVASSKLTETRTKWFASLSAYISQFNISNFRLITVKDQYAFEDLQKNIQGYLKQNVPLTGDTKRHLNQFNDLSMKSELSLGVFLPGGIEDSPYGFNRILEHEMAKMEQRKNPKIISETFSLKGLLRPERMIIVNLEEYSQGHNLQKEWRQIVQAFNKSHQLRHIKNKNLQTVQTVSREPQAIGMDTYDGGDRGLQKGGVRSDKISYLSKKPLNKRETIQRIHNIAKRQTTSQPTSNHKKQEKNTFMRPNRRDPDDINAQGKTTTTIYSPDIHIWLDTSGSISKENYEDEIQTVIAIAKHLNVDIYFNSFSHMVSETVNVPTKNRTPQQIFAMIEHIDKVGGGTDFINVWKAIDKTELANARARYAPRIHIILSDMDYRIPSSYALQSNHPSVKNTYYLPIHMHTQNGRNHLQLFAKSLENRGGKGLASGHILY